MSGNTYFGEGVPVVVLKSLFSKYDVNNDGHLCKKELTVLLENDLGLSVGQMDAYNWLLDKDGDGQLSFHEFKCWMQSNERLINVNNNSRYFLMTSAIKLFERYDVDKSRTLDRREFRKLHADCGGRPEHSNAALNYLDQDGNGVISFYEFLKWLNWVDLGSM